MAAILERYTREQSRTDLAIRMIGHEARTYLIRSCTGLSEDRIRKLYNVYFRQEGIDICRHRGKTPRQPEFFTRTVTTQLEATTFVRVCLAAGLVQVKPNNRVLARVQPDTTEYGQRFCNAYDAYLALHHPPALSFERAWNLVDALCRGHVVGMSTCRRCEVAFLADTLDLQEPICPACCLRSLQ
ncbi:MAG: flagellar transcriptional regulator FlhC [Gammaproteobacteria bacterium]|nr:flagellar transcriptional regulator FlhC [Gammaproteobacteria bacterium]